MLITLALPAYNEEENITTVLVDSVTALKALPYDWEILVINNASTDGMVQKIQEFARTEPRVRLINHELNRLYAGSCATALKEAKGDRIAIMDSDGQHTAADINRFMAMMDKGAELVIGWRRYRSDPLSRKMFSRIFNAMGKYYLSYPQNDLNCGFRMVSRSLAKQVVIKYRINLANPELFVQSKLANVKIGEVEVHHFAREKGRSTMSFIKICRMFTAVNRYFSSLRSEMNQSSNRRHPTSISSSSHASALAPLQTHDSTSKDEGSQEIVEIAR